MANRPHEIDLIGVVARLSDSVDRLRDEVAKSNTNNAVLATKIESIRGDVAKLFEIVANEPQCLTRQVSEIKTRVTAIETEQSRRRKAEESNDKLKKIVDDVVDNSREGKGTWKIYLGVVAGALAVIGGLIALTVKIVEFIGYLVQNGR